MLTLTSNSAGHARMKIYGIYVYYYYYIMVSIMLHFEDHWQARINQRELWFS